MRKQIKIGLIAVALAALSASARADVLFQIAPDGAAAGSDSCLFNLACTSAVNPETTFAPTYVAQEFSLGSAATLQSASFNTYFQGDQYGTGVNWMVLAADGTSGLPGTVIASGLGTAISAAAGVALNGGTVQTVDYSFSTGAVGLAADTNYYLAFQEISVDPNDYLSNGGAAAGLAESIDGGSTWTAGYASNGATSVAVTLYSDAAAAVPEPAGFALLGFGMTVLALRRRRV